MTERVNFRISVESKETTIESLGYYDDSDYKKKILYFTYESRDTLKSFSLFLFAKT